MKILVINPGGTSMRIAMYEGETELWNECIVLDAGWLKENPFMKDQFDGRYEALCRLLEDKGESLGDVDAIAARGGNIAGVHAGAYEVTKELVRRLMEESPIDHASNLGAPLAYALGCPRGIPSYIYDSVASDELTDIARITGIKELPRKGRGHILNMHAVGYELAKRLGRPYHELNLIIAHLGSGISLCVSEKGRLVDVCPDDEGSFSPERAGFIPPYRMIDLIFEHNYTQRDAMKALTREGGLMSLVGSTDFLKLENAAEAGDEWSRLVYEAMALNVAKSIGKLSVVVSGKVDGIVLTGTIARSGKFTGLIAERVQFIAPVTVMAGEFEMKALAAGISRVLSGEERAAKIEDENELAKGKSL